MSETCVNCGRTIEWVGGSDPYWFHPDHQGVWCWNAMEKPVPLDKMNDRATPGVEETHAR